MLPYQRKKIEEQLVKWGHYRHRLQRMDDFRLKMCFNFELSRRNSKMYDFMPYSVTKISDKYL